MKLLLLTLAVIPSLSIGQACFSPSCGPIQPVGTPELCIADVCTPVSYSWTGDIALATATLANGYQVVGWSGPCKSVDRSQCPDIFNQAHRDLIVNALRVNRAINF